MKKLWLIVLLLLIPCIGHSESVKLAWDNPTDMSQVIGFKIHYGVADKTYSSVVSVGLVNLCTVTGLNLSTKYYFVATAISQTKESDYSNQVVYQVPSVKAPPDTTGIKEVP